MIESTSKVAKTDDRFGRYVVLGIYTDPMVKKHRFARVQCDCGSPPRYTRIDGLTSGAAKSCGCLQKESVTKHGEWKNPLFKVWKGILSRCTNPSDKRYARYGGRGITVCDRWFDVHNFINDMSEGYEKGLQIDRKDNNGNYEPDNCQWATTKQQTRNYSRNVILEHNGKRLCVVDWAVETGIDAKVLYDRVARGWNAYKCLTQPVKR